MTAIVGKSDVFENDLLKLIFNNTAITNVGDAGGILGSAGAGSLWWALYTADPTEEGTAVTNETAYTNYLRVIAARSSGGFTVTNNSVSPPANVDFAECGATPGAPLTHFGIVSTSTGAGKLLYAGALTPNITMATGVIPRIKTTSTITEN